MPDGMRNSSRYKSLIPNMPGTGREREAERLAILMDWIWTVVLPKVQPIAGTGGFGSEWQHMCETKTSDAASAAYAAAYAAADAADADAAYAAAYAADATAAADAADAAVFAADATDAASFWEAVDPIGVLERMTYLEMNNAE